MDKSLVFKGGFICLLIVFIVILSIRISKIGKLSLFTDTEKPKSDNQDNQWWLLSNNAGPQSKMKTLSENKKWGNPDRIEIVPNKDKLTVDLNISVHGQRPTLYSATWLNKENCDEIVIYEDIFNKYNPHNAEVFVIVKKLIHVPVHLLGALKYASATINIEQIRTTPEINENYIQTGKVGKSMVSGSCASIIISVLTLDFVLRMVNEYKNENEFYKEPIEDRMREFREEYNKRIHTYLAKGEVGEFLDNWYNYKESVEHNKYKGNANLGKPLF